jgi:hypothetical protein
MNLILQLANKDSFCSIIVKAKINGSCVASLDYYSTKAYKGLLVKKLVKFTTKLKNILKQDTLK